MQEELKLLYQDCGCEHDLLTLAAQPAFKSTLNEFLQDVHSGAIKPGQVHAGYYQHTANKLTSAVAEGLGGAQFGADDYRNTLKAYLDQNVYAFSAAKSLTMLEEFRSYLTDEKGEVIGFEAFNNKVAKVEANYNVAYLEAEYKNAIASAQMAEKWQGLQQFAALEYRTVGDNRVRPEHAALDGLILKTTDPLWKTIYPPNDWACRCSVIPAATTDVPTDSETALRRVKVADVKSYFKRNVGEEMIAFSEGHPYIEHIGSKKIKELDAVKNYGLDTGERIYEMQELPQYTSLPDKENANTWWENVAGGKKESFSLRSADDLMVTFDHKFKTHVLEENTDKRYAFLPQLIDVVKRPDEVWSNRVRGTLQTTYVKYYKNHPIILGVNDARAVTLYEAQKDEKTNFKALSNIRKGILKYKK